MDFLLKTTNLQGGDTRKAPENTQYSKSRHTPEGKGPPHDTLQSLSITAYRLTHKTLSILSNQNTLCQAFLFFFVAAAMHGS